MSDMSEDLEGHYSVQRSKVVDHPEYFNKVLITQYGWAKRGHETRWLQPVSISEIVPRETE